MYPENTTSQHHLSSPSSPPPFSKTTMKTTNITDLPTELQTLIFEKLFDPPLSFSAGASTYSWKSVFKGELPDDLLHAAQASPTLAKAVISAMGPHARYMSFMQTKWPWKWISILKNYVKAVDLGDVMLWHPSYDERNQEPYKSLYDMQEKATLKTLQALDSNKVELEELKLHEVELFNPETAKMIAASMEKAIRSSSSSLKKISLGANQASVQAMRNVTLSKLETVQISTDIHCGIHEDSRSNAPSTTSIAICQILKAIHTNVNQIADTSTVRTLTLDMSIVPTIKFKTCPRLFLGVRKLFLPFWGKSHQGGIAKFISNFKNLEALHWSPNTEVVRAYVMYKICRACPHLKELSLAPGTGCLSPGRIGIPEHQPPLNQFFRSFRNQLLTANFGYLTLEQIKVLGECSPGLTTLYLGIDDENAGALPLLLGNHCRQLRALHLKQPLHEQDCFSRDGWSALSSAVQNAPSCFCTLSFISCLRLRAEEMVDAIVDILESMGDNAKTAKFQIEMQTTSRMVVLKGLERILKSVLVNCNSIENLCFDFVDGYRERFLKAENEEEDVSHLYEAVRDLRRILSASGHLKEVDIGDIEGMVKDREGEN